MSNYRRPTIRGGTYFITQVTYQRIPWLCTDLGRQALREAIAKVRQKYPFEINAFVLLPDHFHCLWTLPEDDHDFSVRMRLIKTHVTKNHGDRLNINETISQSRHKRKEKNLWQRRFWEHLIRDEEDYARHCDYIHYNPVKHGLCSTAQEWQYSSIHRFISEGIYPPDWGSTEIVEKPHSIWDE
ncbi:REP-associated tyrosine transposase [[Limnothrix rosea] IAM M-220]|uniref:REP-associated tyrosine transposase n=1 Tax=[Limnothrix rosea] IAM M-220 TaxID=454133 RepID=UPI000962B2A5|nr:transposase [[Limnothrix rosea] IAM M-220]OKH10761.1 transposase [[Limnothrix rosea] IAM M-220]